MQTKPSLTSDSQHLEYLSPWQLCGSLNTHYSNGSPKHNFGLRRDCLGKKKNLIWSSLHWECQKNLWSQCHHWLNSWAIQRVLWLKTAFLTPWEKMQREPAFGPHCKHKNFLLPFKESLIQTLSFIFFLFLRVSEWNPNNSTLVLFRNGWVTQIYFFFLMFHTPSLHFFASVRHKQRATRIDISVRAYL